MSEPVSSRPRPALFRLPKRLVPPFPEAEGGGLLAQLENKQYC